MWVCVFVCMCANVCWKEMQDASSDSVPRGQTHTHMQKRSWCCGRVNKSELLDLISLITRFIMLI